MYPYPGENKIPKSETLPQISPEQKA
jgi:hypothetical protein